MDEHRGAGGHGHGDEDEDDRQANEGGFGAVAQGGVGDGVPAKRPCVDQKVTEKEPSHLYTPLCWLHSCLGY